MQVQYFHKTSTDANRIPAIAGSYRLLLVCGINKSLAGEVAKSHKPVGKYHQLCILTKKDVDCYQISK